ncbi:hypothetical protein [Mycobacteroides abscessus]|uniref:hypothetical protein n=1 Tax=Mycobacteroides abscessus TaxID=36809 RepID=UPI00092BD53F|nr:hypothetical protein [Mycobacteroides abscessus]QSN49773.1 hypothetical protein I3U33_26960 [Mycobacteroides abscessus subsp. abscessus]SII83355.1 Uncharacterised protein [Mycobacteroides abscessus subsp. abscessus]SIK57754.1 Uncharacterised protein [Mycobacteroides abscessus subsp. abscessus]SIL83869.1 Uncharacterised protein [Mycobacteroides abscessus subsp. abscessus]SIM13053.1 Uncharacterised protein [Mycobacteroides abscessus subsp. abscessus]
MSDPDEVSPVSQGGSGWSDLSRVVLSQGLFFGGLAVIVAAVAGGSLTGQWAPSVLFLTMGAMAMYWSLHVDTSGTVEHKGPETEHHQS